MEEATFQSALKRFRVVRQRDAVIGVRAATQKRGKSALGHLRNAGAEASTAAAVGGGEQHVAAMKDFWSGLNAFLAKHFDEASAKRVAAAFDELHYGSLRQLSTEDLEDVCGMLTAELQQ